VDEKTLKIVASNLVAAAREIETPKRMYEPILRRLCELVHVSAEYRNAQLLITPRKAQDFGL